jgi:hypothetical protein
MKRKSSLFLAFVFGALVIRCGGTTGPQSGSESHFLDVCTAATPCGSGFSCVCGICTRTCTDGSACAGLAAGAVCAAACNGGDRHCDVECRSSSDCADLGAAFTCEGGACRQITPVGNEPDASAEASVPKKNDGGMPTRRDAGSFDAAVSTPDARARLDARVSKGDATSADAVAFDVITTRCDGSGCFCKNLPSCVPAEDFAALPLGSAGRRICGVKTRSGNPGGLYCDVTAYTETEGGVIGLRCDVPLGDACDSWPPPSGCRQVLTCNVLMQSCPVDLLDCSRPEQAPDAAVDSGNTP